LILAQPSSWPDPYEQLLWRTKFIQRTPDVKQAMLAPYLPVVYAQCWSAAEYSETLLRAYSRVVQHPLLSRNQVPGDEAVAVASTPRKLLECLQVWAPPEDKDCCFIGRVRYFNDTEVREQIGITLGQRMPEGTISGRQMAELILLKRSAFRHEDEIRLIYIKKSDVSPPRFMSLEINPNTIFKSVIFDPRLVEFERKERESIIRALGYDGSVDIFKLYVATALTIMIN